jgi:5-methylcytosine-specific restriction enzyme A
MKIFIHDVGKVGAREDFPKTVFSKVKLAHIQNSVNDPITKASLLNQLRQLFPSEEFNCWGVPLGATAVIRNLRPGDFVFLIESMAGSARIPALCEVKVYQPIAIPELSQTLWGNNRYPYIFFFDTDHIDYTWHMLRDSLEYKSNYREWQRSRVYKVANMGHRVWEL